jgi:hypothetical protein
LPALKIHRKVYREEIGQEVDGGFVRLEFVDKAVKPYVRMTYSTPEVSDNKRLEFQYGIYDGIWDADLESLIKDLQTKESFDNNDIIYSVQLTRKFWESVIPLRNYKDDINSDIIYYLERQSHLVTDLASVVEALKNGRVSQMSAEKQLEALVKIDKLTTQILRFDTPPDGLPLRKRLP